MADTVEIDIIARVDQAVSGIGKLVSHIAKAYVSVEAFKKIVIDSFKAYEEAEMAEVRLGTAMKLTGQYSQQALAGLVGYSKRLQEMSIFDAAATQSASALLMQIGRLSVSGVQSIIPHLQDYAAAMGVDLVTAARDASAAIEGGRNTFLRYGISLKDAADPTSRMEALIQGLTNKFGGMSEAVAQTTAGQLTVFKNQINELKEAFGELEAKLLSPVLKNILLGISVTKIMAAPASSLTDIVSIKNAIKLVTEEKQRVEDAVAAHLRWVGPNAQKDIAEYANKIEALQRQLRLLGNMPKGNTPPILPSGGDLNDSINGIGQLTNAVMDYTALGPRIMANTKAIQDNLDAYKKAYTNRSRATGGEAEVDDPAKQAQELAGQMQSVADAAKGFAEAIASGDVGGFFRRLISQAVDALVPMALLAAAKAAIAGDYATMAVWLGVAGMTIAAGVGLSDSGGRTPGTSSLPHMAEGGIVTGPTLALIGESGPEKVIPLGRGGGGNTIIVQGSIWSARDLARELAGVAGQW